MCKMQPYQQPFRIIAISITLFIVWNIFISVSLAIAGGMASHVPQILWDILKVYMFVVIVGLITINLPKLNYKRKMYVAIIVLIVSLIPTAMSFTSPLIISYINRWESKHCLQTGVDSMTKIETLKCDNGDTVFKESQRKRTYPGGIKGTHFPYSYFL